MFIKYIIQIVRSLECCGRRTGIASKQLKMCLFVQSLKPVGGNFHHNTSLDLHKLQYTITTYVFSMLFSRHNNACYVSTLLCISTVHVRNVCVVHNTLNDCAVDLIACSFIIQQISPVLSYITIYIVFLWLRYRSYMIQ